LAREQRKLAAILAADVAGYSRLMGRDESGTLARLKEHHSERLEPALGRNRGRLVKLTGDGVLAEFGSAVDALRAAIELQQAVADANRDQPADTRIVFRIGLHLGDVIVDDDDLYGDGVNIAARLEGQAPAGGIVVSGAVHDSVAGKLKAALHDLGALTLKNIERAVPAYRVEWTAADWPAQGSATTTAADKPAIAVLPFHNMSGDAEQDYFADGVTEDTIAALSRFRELLVLSRGATFVFRDRNPDTRRIARQLRARYVLSGSVRKAGNRLRVTAELTDAESGGQIWADRYDRDLADFFDLQDELSRTVAAVVHPAIRGAEIARARRKPPASLSAHDLYLRALPHMWASTREDIPKAIDLLRRSLALDAASAPALAALSFCLSLGPAMGAMAPSPEIVSEAMETARKAVETDANDAFAQAIYATSLCHIVDDYEQGRLHADEAVRLNPGSAFAWGSRGTASHMSGDFGGAVESLERAIALSPEDNMLAQWMSGLALAHFALGSYDSGIGWARRAVQHNPSFGTAHRLLAANLVAAGRLEEAREVTRKRDAVQRTTLREIRGMALIRHAGVMNRYIEAQRAVGVPD
jgi:TolB-like protein/class 3 adenylate cyclase/Flp pilus assembly protein TadD